MYLDTLYTVTCKCQEGPDILTLGGQADGLRRWLIVCRTGLVLETGLFSDHGEQGDRSAAWLVHPGLPFTDGLLAGTQLLGHFLLGQSQMMAEGLNLRPVPLRPFGAITFRHILILVDSG
jgi:hypothetical protein